MTDAAPGLSHAVYFTLKKPNEENRRALVDACRSLLSDHPGLVHFSAGVRGSAYRRPVNDQDFDVALTLVFATEADHEHYQSSPAHQKFLAEHGSTWAKVRVFDALVEAKGV